MPTGSSQVALVHVPVQHWVAAAGQSSGPRHWQTPPAQRPDTHTSLPEQAPPTGTGSVHVPPLQAADRHS